MHPHGDCVWAGAPREVMEANTRCVRTDAGPPKNVKHPIQPQLSLHQLLYKKRSCATVDGETKFHETGAQHAKLTWGWEAGVFTRGETWPFYETYKAQILDASKTITL